MEENRTDQPLSLEEEVPNDESNAINSKQTQQKNESFIKSSPLELRMNSNINENDDVIKNEMAVVDFNQQINNSSLSMNMPNEIDECNVDLSNYLASVNINNFKMLSILDFAGHSAYYACHHIFYSPRAVFILVVDMTKDFKNVATEACRKSEECLIYSNWTYAGNLLDLTTMLKYTYNIICETHLTVLPILNVNLTVKRYKTAKILFFQTYTPNINVFL